MTVVPMAIKAQACASCNCLFKQGRKQISDSILQARKYHLVLFTHKREPGATCGCSSADTARRRHSNAPVCVCARVCVHYHSEQTIRLYPHRLRLEAEPEPRAKSLASPPDQVAREEREKVQTIEYYKLREHENEKRQVQKNMEKMRVRESIEGEKKRKIVRRL